MIPGASFSNGRISHCPTCRKKLTEPKFPELNLISVCTYHGRQYTIVRFPKVGNHYKGYCWYPDGGVRA